MKKYLFLPLVGLSLLSFSQEIPEKDSLLSKPKPAGSVNSDVFCEKILFQDQDLLLVRQTKTDGTYFVTLRFAENSPIEISNQGEIKLHNGIIAKNLQLTNIPFQRTMNPNYSLDVNDLEKYIRRNKKLPNFPSNEELSTSGIDVSDFQMKLLKEVEELTLIVIDQNKRIENMEKDIKKMKIIMVNRPSG